MRGAMWRCCTRARGRGARDVVPQVAGAAESSRALTHRDYGCLMDPMRHNLSDRCVLLFSTDWFRPYWPLLGLRVFDGQKNRFLDAMRSAVRDLVGQENDYFNISSGDMRVARTRKLWLDAVSSFTPLGAPSPLLDLEGCSLDERRQVRDEIVRENYLSWDELMSRQWPSLAQSDWDIWVALITASVPDYLRTFAWSVGYDPSDRY